MAAHMHMHAGGRYYGRYYEVGSCEALEGVERAAAHPATSWQTVGEGEAAGGRESPHGAGLLYDARREAYMNVFRRYYDTNPS